MNLPYVVLMMNFGSRLPLLILEQNNQLHAQASGLATGISLQPSETAPQVHRGRL